MSTRATYKFDNDKYIYIHHDNYPSGACYYFKNAIKRKNKNFYESFIKSNECCELTNNHESHKDTQYRYEISSINNELYISAYKLNKNNKFIIFFQGLLNMFIDLHQNQR